MKTETMSVCYTVLGGGSPMFVIDLTPESLKGHAILERRVRITASGHSRWWRRMFRMKPDIHEVRVDFVSASERGEG